MTRRLISYFPAALFAAALLLYRSECAAAAGEGAALCARALIPALFPFFVLSAFVMNAGLSGDLSRLFSKTRHGFFGLPGAFAVPFILGLTGGYPVGASSVCALFDAGLCSKKDAERALFFCNNCGAAFLFGVCPALFAHPRAGVLLFFSNLLSALFCAALSRLFFRKSAPSVNFTAPPVTPALPFGEALTNALYKALRQTASVCACVVFFFCLLRALEKSGALGLLSRALSLLLFPLGVSLPLSGVLARGAFEMTGGVYALSALSGVKDAAKMCAAAFIISFGGLSVHLQSLSPALRSRLSPRLYFAGKTVQALFSAAFCRVLYIILK